MPDMEPDTETNAREDQVTSHSINWCTGTIESHPPTEEVSQTIRTSPGGENGVVQVNESVAFLPTNSSNARSIGAEEELSPTLAKGGGESGNKPSVAIGFKYRQSEKSQKPFAENGEALALSSGCHDSAVAIETAGITEGAHGVTLNESATTIQGTGGKPGQGYPAVVTKVPNDAAISFEPGLATREGKDSRFSNEVVSTLRANMGDNHPAVALGMNAEPGNYDECYLKETALPLTVKHKGGIATEMSTPEQAETEQTDNGEVQSVRIGESIRLGAETIPECAHTLRAADGKIGDNSPAIISSILSQMRYIVRRLTPTECERLMGLPDGYTIPVGLEVTDELVAEFQKIHDTFNAIMAEYEHKDPPKPKSEGQVRKWLTKITDPKTCPDSPRYKACGNGWATNQPRWILARLLELDEQDNREQKD